MNRWELHGLAIAFDVKPAKLNRWLLTVDRVCGVWIPLPGREWSAGSLNTLSIYYSLNSLFIWIYHTTTSFIIYLYFSN